MSVSWLSSVTAWRARVVAATVAGVVVAAACSSSPQGTVAVKGAAAAVDSAASTSPDPSAQAATLRAALAQMPVNDADFAYLDLPELLARSAYLVVGRLQSLTLSPPVAGVTIPLRCESGEGVPANGTTSCGITPRNQSSQWTFVVEGVVQIKGNRPPAVGSSIGVAVGVGDATNARNAQLADEAFARVRSTAPIGASYVALVGDDASSSPLVLRSQQAWALLGSNGDDLYSLAVSLPSSRTGRDAETEGIGGLRSLRALVAATA